jgi:hypothetical protein
MRLNRLARKSSLLHVVDRAAGAVTACDVEHHEHLVFVDKLLARDKRFRQ